HILASGTRLNRSVQCGWARHSSETARIAQEPRKKPAEPMFSGIDTPVRACETDPTMTDRAPEDPAVEQVREQISRRGFLKIGVLGGMMAASGGVLGLAFRSGALRDAPADLKVFSRAEYSVLAALGDLICPAIPPDLPGASALDVAAQVDKM